MDSRNQVRINYGSEIAFNPKRLKNILSDLNIDYKNEETKFMFLVNEHQTFIRSISTQERVEGEAVLNKIENLCGFNKVWTENVSEALFAIIGKTFDPASNNWVNEAIAEELSGNADIEIGDKLLSFDNLLNMAVSGNIDAQLEVADCYYKGKDIKQDYKQAFYWYQKLSKTSNSYVWEQMGDCYFFGFGTEQNYRQAIQWFEKAANDDRSYSQARLGYCFYVGKGVEKDYAHAFRLFIKSAENNNPWGMSLVGDCYYYGRGTEKDLSSAFRWFEKSAENNRSYSQARVGKCYYTGEGVPIDYGKALYWYNKSADNNDAWGMSLLGDYYYDGKAVPADYDKALTWYKKASEKGDAWSMKQLGIMFCNGDGCKCDYDTAVIWLEKAAKAGNEKAKEVLEQVRVSLPIKDSLITPAVCANDIVKGSWGPEREKFTWNNPATYIIFNSIYNNPSLGNERNFVRVKKTGTDDKYRDTIEVSAGNEYTIYIYYLNP